MINKLNLNEQIYETLKRDIFTNRIENGTLLVNKDLQTRFGVSSSPIRDAINRLSQDGLIDKITRSGAEVITLDYDVAREINELMIIITKGAVELCFKNDNRAGLINDATELLKAHKKNLYSNKYFHYDYLFHKLFFDYSKNNKLILLYKQFSVVFEMAVRSLDKITLNERHRENSLMQHQNILDSFIDNDFESAKKHITNHYLSADKVFEKHFKNKKEC
ncbi:GntR family transcriptional regulator [Peptostreptococcaceae bacterium OttesenSCG-928-C18]|nr:GntR family transcriptional regulator [Peptostreptococcaceae bacterium OttesenSCG-928-C18]